METSNEIVKTPLEKIFNNTPARILDFLILNKKFDYSLTDISKATNVDIRTLQRVLPILVDEELVVKTRLSGKNKMYVFNRGSQRGKALEMYFEETKKRNIEQLEYVSKIKREEKLQTI